MKWTYKILRAVIVTAIALIIGIPALLYVALLIPVVQNAVKEKAETELSGLMDTDIKIGRLNITPFSDVDLFDVIIADSKKRPAATVGQLSAGVSLPDLLLDKKIVINHVEIIGMNAHLSKDRPDAPLNILNIINALSKKEPDKEPAKFDLQIRDIIIRRSTAHYDVLSKPRSAKFNPDHIALTDIDADIDIPRLSNDFQTFRLKHFSANEASGVTITRLTADVDISPETIVVRKPVLVLPSSRIALADISLPKPFELNNVTVTAYGRANVAVNDISPFIPDKFLTSSLPQSVTADFDIAAHKSEIDIRRLILNDSDNTLSLDAVADVSGFDSSGRLSVNVPRVSVHANTSVLAPLLASASERVRQIVNNAGTISIDGGGKYSPDESSFDGSLTTAAGNIAANIDYKTRRISGTITTNALNIGRLISDNRIGNITADINVDLLADTKNPQGQLSAKVVSLQTQKYNFRDISVVADVEGKEIKLKADIDDPNLVADLDGSINIAQNTPHIITSVNLVKANPERFGIADKFPEYIASAHLDIDAEASDIDNLVGTATLSDVVFSDGHKTYSLENVTVVAENNADTKRASLHSDLADANVEGEFSFKDIIPYAKNLASKAFPSLIEYSPKNEIKPIYATFNATVKDSKKLNEWVTLPVNVIYPIAINGKMSTADGLITMKIDAPYLQQKDKLIENSSVEVTLAENNPSGIYATTTFPTKKGPAIVNINANGGSDRLDTDINWQIRRERTFKGNIDLTADFSRNNDNRLRTLVNINPSQLVFNDTIWNIDASTIDIEDKRIKVKNFNAGRDEQFISIEGVASENPDDILTLELKNIDLDYIFETLAIENAMFGGIATGQFFANNLLNGAPHLATPDLKVKGLKYNFCTLGDAVIKSEWNNDLRAVDINANISQENDCYSTINGSIFPLADSLDLRFHTQRINVGFLKPFMAAFTDEVSGLASGDAHLWGTFKDIDLEGDIYAEDFKLKIGYTNTYYHTTDSVHIVPGRIEFNNLSLYDDYGNTGKLNGWLSHDYFHDPRFEFTFSDVHDMLVYDITPELSHDWYGRIFGNGVAKIVGEPGRIDIDVNMATGNNSVFTFVLSDMENAYEYDFITFRDKTPRKDTISVVDPTPAIVRQLKQRIANQQQEQNRPTTYGINLQIEATPEAQMVIVMDPVGGDKIKGYGAGNLRITYNSADEAFEMFGSYTLQRGSYNFTLQDIIIKDFSIRDGSSISFQGDPLAAVLDINAVYAVNANLSDLDESFLQDRELNRTNIPVHAILKVTGDMRQPDVGFDLEFPTLTNSQDVLRKVKSIISTDDMMSRQIVYLLALNRFYTPDYVSSATKGNELMSVASSTITSHIRSMLGQLSDKWVIAPQLRSDKGDFSDVEVDLALSSNLLNNRLLLNGNLGYRDKALNNNQFVGDFDIEYLLSKSGTFRLKAYNRFNDQNYYTKTALTTQGVGIAFKKDFNSFFSFLKKFRKNRPETESKPQENPDSTVIIQPNDSINVTDNKPDIRK